MYHINRLAVWLMRIGHCRGFGVQSPSDYAFIRYVVNEHYPYYAYTDLERELPDVGRLERKLCRLYFRIANFLQPATVVDYRSKSPAGSRYIRSGCRKARIVTGLDGIDSIDMLRMSLGDGDDIVTVLSEAIAKAHDGSVFVVEGIRRGKAAKALWRQITEDDRVRVTLDLYYAGIVFFDRSRYRQSYKVNF